jgi:DNA-binding NarL/FixJ family response regulator
MRREKAVRKIRVLVANRPRLMRDLVLATISNQPDIEVVGEAQNESEITELVDTVRPDIVIIALDQTEGRPELCGFLLGRYPRMKVLAVAPEENNSILYTAFVDIRAKRVENSEEGLLNSLRNPDTAEIRSRAC